jgi:acylphosphatase
VAIVNDIRRVHVLVTGDVQGVGFRWFTRECAQRCKVGGWVRNTSGGQVELVAQGTRADVETFLDAIRRGPSRAHVENVQIRDDPPQQDPATEFEIRR